MNPIQKLMGRRQFLIAAGVTSTCALTCDKLANFERGVAVAAEKTSLANAEAAGNKCPNLLSPLRIRNAVLKNRIMHTVSPPYLMQGPENFPTAAYRNHFSNMAKNAAIVSLDNHFGTYPRSFPAGNAKMGLAHFSDQIWEDIPTVYNYIERMIEDIHCEGALVRYVPSMNMMPSGGGQGGAPGAGGSAPGGATGAPGSVTGAPGGAPGSGSGMSGEATTAQASAQAQGAGMPGGSAPGGQGGAPGGGEGGGPQQTTQTVEEIVEDAKAAEEQGYDVYQMNTTTQEAVQAVRNATNLILMAALRVGSGRITSGRGGADMSGYKWVYEGIDADWQFGEYTPGITNINQPTEDELEKAVESARKLEGLVDFLWIRDGRHEHPNSWTQDKERPFNLAYAEAIKKAGVKVLVCPSAGFHDPVQNDGFIAAGMADMIGMTTPFFADPDLVEKVMAGRADDVLPCIQCHNCHGVSRTEGPWYNVCTVNPKWAAPAYKLASIKAPVIKKKVAVIGGGPGGMKAALTAAERGHKVTLYEKGGALGGLLRFTDYTQWKWNYKDIKDYLAYQVKKAGVEIRLNTEATPSMIRSKRFDAVLVATGAEPVISRMSGADAENVFNILTAYSNKAALGKEVVVIGAGRIGTECAIGIAKDGHKVTQITSGTDLIEMETIGSHNMMNQISILQNHPDYSCILKATVKGITGGKVTYTDSEGKEKSIKADSVVIYSGFKPMMDEAMKFEGTAAEVLLLGDCTGKNGTVQKTMRSAYFVASRV